MLEIIYELGDDYGRSVSVSNGFVLGVSLSILAFTIAFYVLRSFGIYKLAVNQGINHAFMAFIPCVWIYTACKLIGKARFFGSTFEKIALTICIIFSVSQILPIAYNFLRLFPYIAYYLEGGTITISVGTETVIAAGNDFNNLFDTQAINVIIRILSVLSSLFNIAEIVITVFVYISLFKKFWPQHYILASVLSFFGLFPIFVFAIRNNKPVNYADYIRSRFYGYGQNNPSGYDGSGSSGGMNNNYSDFNSRKQDDPFSEFSDKPDDPFSEFDNDKKDDEEWK